MRIRNIMKTIFKRLAVLTVLVLLFNSCTKDSIPSDTPVAKTRVKITGVWVTSIPNSNGGLYWDSSTNSPDIYIKCYDEIGTLAASTTTVWNFIPTTNNPFTVSFTNPITTTDLVNTILKVQVWDDDSDNNATGLNPDDKIGEVPFYINEYTTGANKYPNYAIKAEAGTVVTIFFTWE